MSDPRPVSVIGDNQIEIRFPEERRGLLSRMTGRASPAKSFFELPPGQRDLLFAIADLRAWGDAHENEVEVGEDHLRISHDAAASLNSASAMALGLPDDVHLTLRTDVTGTVGSPDFRLAYEWSDEGRRVIPKRRGAFVETTTGPRRLPLWMKRALDLADGFDAKRPIEEHWRILADFRRTLEPEDDQFEDPSTARQVANLAMTSFLRGLEVRIANQFSISPDSTLGQFEVLPYSSRTLDERGVASAGITEGDAELSGEGLAVFQYRLRQRGARPAYQLGNNSYLVIDSGSMPVLEEIARAQRADREERKAFIQNPRAFIAQAVTRHLESSEEFQELDQIGQEEMVESVAGTAFIESREYSERVQGTIVYQRPSMSIEGSGTTWLPEVFSELVAGTIAEMPTPDLERLRDQMTATLDSGEEGPVRIGEENVQVRQERLAAVEGLLKVRQEQGEGDEAEDEDGSPQDQTGPIILATKENEEELAWSAQIAPRAPAISTELPDTIVTALRPYQVQGFEWATQAWRAGLPGILNADEQGLGKTLQTISFLSWLQAHMSKGPDNQRGPIMVVAPTSLLRNWEQEVERHVAPRRFGHLVRLYGSSLSGHKTREARGTETSSGLPLLDLDWLDEAREEGRAHRFWILTTYTTLANYQHSLAGIRLAALVMDEVQNIKNKDTIASKACAAMNADFRVGLTGTPIENSTNDLWTIMDRLAPGALGSAVEFRGRYGTPDVENMAELHARVFKPKGELPPLGLRRLKDEVATDLPTKTRLLYPRLMPGVQSKSYEEARAKMASGGPGAALKMLHHIRSASVHPALHEVAAPDTFIGMSARLAAVMEILEDIARKGERALVFIEHRAMQFRFAELVCQLFGRNHIDIINGDTPIAKRQDIVNRFQQHLAAPDKFDLLILGPRAAGTGLTLTAATHVLHLSRWWNPAVEEQCNDRVHRIGQTRPVTVHVPMAVHPAYREHSFDCLLQSLMQRKRRMASQALWPMGDTAEDLNSLRQGLDGTATASEVADPVRQAIAAMFARDGVQSTVPDERGAYAFP